ncbi:transcriptional regulator GlxA family with amidase domain [Sphingomonas zeae]|uniref:Helix-turn-helix domain-containing protein n=2 Tax=Sphingomonas zeae TaxID=1646122 RepID=A0A7Y6B2U2_9SPHN|nr:DJ-1/PfpI family protein [Sphingomonas zeae]MBB4050195.1 transcriptional regulator GlxA family with amidase domain [Sphingomonas zeae]NUU45452.1 helix-turn-helix domain-containing protein [Sphingomonas zeae]
MSRPSSHHVTMFAPADLHSLEISGVMDAFHEANRQSGQPLYDLCVVAETCEPIRCASGVRIVPDCTIDDAPAAADTVFITGSYGIPETPSDRVLAWIGEQAHAARRFGAVCTGTFLIGAAGLIDGRRVTTHWDYADALGARYPAARLDADAIFIRDGALFTSAGVTAAIDLALALIEEDHGRDLAMAIARHMVIYLKRPGGQSQYSVHLVAQTGRRTPIEQVQRWAAEHPDADLGTAALAARAAMSPRNFTRIFRQETGATPAEFVQRLRIDFARRLLEETDLPLAAVARAAGLGTAASARRAFLRVLGITMRQYRDRF